MEVVGCITLARSPLMCNPYDNREQAVVLWLALSMLAHYSNVDLFFNFFQGCLQLGHALNGSLGPLGQMGSTE